MDIIKRAVVKVGGRSNAPEETENIVVDKDRVDANESHLHNVGEGHIVVDTEGEVVAETGTVTDFVF